MRGKSKIYNINDLNNKITSDVKKVILDAESKYRGQLFALADKILHKKSVNMVLLAGPSCAGKTTTARLLQEIFEKRGKHVVAISMDDFFKNRADTPLLPNGLKDYDNPKTINIDQIRECFTTLYKKGKAMFPVYDFISGKNIPNSKEIEIKYNSIIIFEGLHVLNPYILENLGETNYFTIYVNALSSYKGKAGRINKYDLRLLRRMIRDVGRRGNSIEHTLKTWETVCEAEKKYIDPYIKNANEIVDTTHSYELGIFKPEFDKLMEDNKKKYIKQIPFCDVIDSIEAIDKSMLPQTTLMKEFMDIPEHEPAEKKVHETQENAEN